jgi:integrase
MALLRSVLRAAASDWEWIDRAPKVRLLQEASGRVRFLSPEEASRLISELPEHLAALVSFSILTGLRQRNARELRWSQVDLERRAVWIHPHEAKARRGISVPLTLEATKIVEQQKGKHAEFVFTFRGKPLRSVNNTAWRSALRRAGISGFRWHDLRHTWATWHAKAGTLLHVLQELGGWASAGMVKRYAHFTADHLASYVDDFGKTVRLQPGVYDSATQTEGAA